MRRGRAPAAGSGYSVTLRVLRIETADLVRAELVEERNVLRVERDAVGCRTARERDERNLSRSRIERPDEAAALHGEDDESASRKHEAVRIAGFRIRHLVLGDFAGLRFDLADEARRVARVPDVAVGIFEQAVRAGVGRRQRILLEASGRRIEPPDGVRQLGGVPGGSVTGSRRIVRERADAWRHPLVELDFDDIAQSGGCQSG